MSASIIMRWGSSYILHILGQYDHIDLVGLQQFIQAVHGTQISGQTLAGGGVQVAHILHGGASAALNHIAEEAVSQLPAAMSSAGARCRAYARKHPPACQTPAA